MLITRIAGITIITAYRVFFTFLLSPPDPPSRVDDCKFCMSQLTFYLANADGVVKVRSCKIFGITRKV